MYSRHEVEKVRCKIVWYKTIIGEVKPHNKNVCLMQLTRHEEVIYVDYQMTNLSMWTFIQAEKLLTMKMILL